MPEPQRTRPCGGCFVCAGRIPAEVLTCENPIPIDDHGNDVAPIDQLRGEIEAGWRGRAEAAEAEVARLRAGESDQPAAEGVWPTPAEWIRRWNDATPDQRLARAQQILAEAGAASRCEMARHDDLIIELGHWTSTVLDLTQIVRDLADPGQCEDFDDHGHCQTHGWLQDGVCPHARARDILAAQEAGENRG